MRHDPVFDNLAHLRSRCHRDDRRAKPRLRCNGIAEVILLRLDQRFPATLLDLSVSGCCLATETPIPSIESPAIEVQLAVNGTNLRVAGVVRNVRNERKLGIEFMNVTPRRAEQIRELVTELFERANHCRAESRTQPD